MLSIRTTNEFELDFQRMVRAGKDPQVFWDVIEILVAEESVPDEFRDHELSGKWSGVRDIHIEADWLLLYRVVGKELVLIRTGAHSDLF